MNGAQVLSSMPSRPRAHEVEDRSRRQFEDWLPDGWVARPISADYGIDYEIEVFENGHATGLHFWVQLKGSDAPEPPPVKIARTTKNYWNAREGLVLLVVWSVTAGTGWYQWAHHIPTWQMAPEQQTLTVRVPITNRLHDDARAKLVAEVVAHRAWDTSSLHLPIPVRCIGRGSIAGESAGEVVAAARMILASFPDAVQVGTGDGPIRITVRIGGDAIVADVAGGATTDFAYSGPLGRETSVEAVEALAWDVVLAVALQLFRMNLGEQSGLLVERSWPRSPVATNAFLPQVVVALVGSGRIGEALDYARVVDSAHEGVDALVWSMILEVIPKGRQLDAALHLSRWAQHLSDEGDRGNAARLFYNASSPIHTSEPALSLAMLDSAAELDPSYRERSYWWSDHAIARFHAGEFDDAAADYARATALGAQGLLCREADCHVLAGRYRKGVEMMAAHADAERGGAEWRLTARCVQRLIDIVGVDEQAREPEAAIALLGDELPTLDQCTAALKRDMLCVPALLALNARMDDEVDVLILRLAAAVFERSSPELWLNALEFAPLAERALHEDALVTARKAAGVAIDEHLEAEEREDEAAALRALFNELPSDPPYPNITRVTATGSAVYEEEYDEPPSR